MLFQKRHYSALAKLIEKSQLPPRYKIALANDHADLFANDNPKFDRQRFLVACGMKSKS